MIPQEQVKERYALLTLAAIVSTARNEPDSPLKGYVLSITEDLELPERYPRENPA